MVPSSGSTSSLFSSSHEAHNQKPSPNATHHDWYSSHLHSLTTTTASESDSDSDSLLLYTDTTAYHGFAASLDPIQAESLRHSDSVLAVNEDTLYSLHTGIWPESKGMPDLPSKWVY